MTGYGELIQIDIIINKYNVWEWGGGCSGGRGPPLNFNSQCHFHTTLLNVDQF